MNEKIKNDDEMKWKTKTWCGLAKMDWVLWGRGARWGGG